MKAKTKDGGTRRGQKKKQTAANNSGSAARLKIDTILLPIDFSRACLQAVPWAKVLKRATKCTIHLVHVHGYEYPLPAGMLPPAVASAAEITERLQRHLKKFATSQGLSGAAAHCHVRTGNAADQICKVAEAIDADFIVTSTHGHTGWKQVFLGSTAERLVRHAPCPVLIARQPTSGRGRVPSLQRITVPLDFSRASSKGLGFAIRLAQSFGAELTLLHVVNHDQYLTPEGAVMYAGPDVAERAAQIANERLQMLIDATDFGGVKFKTAVPSFRGGTVEDAICAYAANRAMDLIVSTTHGRTGLRHTLLGSVAEHIVRYAKGPVLVVPTRRGAKG